MFLQVEKAKKTQLSIDSKNRGNITQGTRRIKKRNEVLEVSIPKTCQTTLRCPHGYVSYIPDTAQEYYASYMINIVVNSLFCLPSAFVNAFVIAAVFTSPKLKKKPSNVLLCSLTFTDLGVDLVAQPLHATSRMAEMVEDFPTYCVTWLVSRIIGRWLSNVSLNTLVAISIDCLLAIYLKTRYSAIVTCKRVVAALAAVWCIAALVACVRLFAPVGNFLIVAASSYLICLGVMFLAYLKSYQALRAHQKRVQTHGGKAVVNVAGYRRSLNTMLLILGFTLLCYSPYICVSTYLGFSGRKQVEWGAWTIVDLFIGVHEFSFQPFLLLLENSAFQTSHEENP